MKREERKLLKLESIIIILSRLSSIFKIQFWFKSLFGDFNELLDLFVQKKSCLVLSNHHNFDVFVAWFNNIKQSLDNELQSLLITILFLVVLLQKFTHLLWISSTTLSSPLRERSRRVSVVQMRSSIHVKTCNQAAYSKRSHSSLLSVLLLSLSNKLRDVFNWRAVIVVKAIALALDAGFVSQNTAISSQSWVSHMNVIVKLYNFFHCPALLKLSYGFFLSYWCFTYTARITDESVTSPTAQRPFFTASMAYSTWKRCPFGENTVIAVSYI